MNKLMLLVFLLLIGTSNLLVAQTSTFYGARAEFDICESTAAFTNDKLVSDLVSSILDKIGIKNRYIIMNCPSVDNCLATSRAGRLYILYNAGFMESIKGLSFTVGSLPTKSAKDWKSLTILSHELGHHLNQHLTNPPQGMSRREMELEADEQAGFLMKRIGSTLTQAQSVMYSDFVPVAGTTDYPSRQERLDAIAKGYYDAEAKTSVPNPRTFSASEIINAAELRVKKDFDDTSGDQIAYNYYLKADKEYLDQIAEVRYIRDHDTMPEKRTNSYQSSKDRRSNFQFSGYQWGYIIRAYVQVILKDGSKSDYRLFDIKYDN